MPFGGSSASPVASIFAVSIALCVIRCCCACLYGSCRLVCFYCCAASPLFYPRNETSAGYGPSGCPGPDDGRVSFSRANTWIDSVDQKSQMVVGLFAQFLAALGRSEVPRPIYLS